jgi:predicted phosphodiesterase
MRYAVISDIHANLEALNAVVDALSKDQVDAHLCVGDVIGYGANPKECIKIVRSLGRRVLIAGNHEHGVLGQISLEYFTDYAREAVVWTRGVLDKDEADFLRSFELVHKEGKFTLVHGSLESPAEFNYIFNSDEAAVTAALTHTPVCFVGHTHSPGIFYLDSGRMERLSTQQVKVDHKKKYVINAGSVGQPRDGDPRASYVIYDEESGDIEIRRAAYDINTAQKKILASGLPPVLAHRLSEGR